MDGIRWVTRAEHRTSSERLQALVHEVLAYTTKGLHVISFCQIPFMNERIEVLNGLSLLVQTHVNPRISSAIRLRSSLVQLTTLLPGYSTYGGSYSKNQVPSSAFRGGYRQGGNDGTPA